MGKPGKENIGFVLKNKKLFFGRIIIFRIFFIA